MDPADDSTFRLLVEQSPDGHFIIVDDVFTYLNAAATEMFGWGANPPDRPNVLDFIDPSDHERCQRNMVLRQSGALRGASSYLGVRKDGSNFPIEVHTAPLGSGGGVALHGVVRDVSDRKELEDVLVRSEQDGLLARLASGTAHDFNNLLAVIQSNAEVIQAGEDNDQAAAALKRILAAVRRGEQKVAQMQRLRAGPGPSSKPTSTHLNPLVEEVLELTRARWRDEAELQGVRYEILWDPGSPPAVIASPSDLRAALVALVFNAVEAMPDGGVLTLRTGSSEDLASISIQDTGEGIDSTDLEALSDVFYTTRSDRKVGLGLHLVRRVVWRQGGRLELESTVGEGATFTVLLSASSSAPDQPAPPLSFVQQDARSIPTVPEPARPKTVGGRRVLLVDDQADLVQVLRNILEVRGFEVDVAVRGREGLEYAASIKYSVVLTDLGMPDMSGWEFAAEVRALQPRTPIVLMTGWAAEIEAGRLEREGIHSLLPKPFRGEQLLETIADAIETRRLASQLGPL